MTGSVQADELPIRRAGVASAMRAAGTRAPEALAIQHAALRTGTGAVHTLDTRRWWAEATEADLTVLAAVTAPVIDLGCGPGRLVAALAERGRPALGIDVAPGAIAAARSRGATVLERSVFGPLPGEGRWASALLFDGNVGIGGDPVALLRRVRSLVRPSGTVVVELGEPGLGLRRDHVVLEVAGSRIGPFPWAWVGADVVTDVAAEAGLAVRRCVPVDRRWFAWLAPESHLDASVAPR